MTEDNHKSVKTPPSGLEDIDFSVFDWVENDLDIYVQNTNQGGTMKVPVIWMAGERAYQIKQQQHIRDDENALIFPLITIERTAKEKNLTDKGAVFAEIPHVSDYKGGTITISRRVQQDKTQNFRNAYGQRQNKGPTFKTSADDDEDAGVVYEHLSIPQPIYVNNTYTVTVRTDFQQHKNTIEQTFLNAGGTINYLTKDWGGFRHEYFIQSDFSEENNLSNFNEEERIFKTQIDVRVLGYMTGDDTNRDEPNSVVRESITEVSIEEEVKKELSVGE